MNRNQPSELEGVVVPLVTPLRTDGSVDAEGVARQAKRCLSSGVSAVFLGGSAGMGPMLTSERWNALLESGLEGEADTDRRLVGIMETSTPRAIERIKMARALGYRRFVVTPSFYITLQREREFLAHFEQCAAAAEAAIVLYNIPGCTYSWIPQSVVSKLAEAGVASGLKESSGDREYFARVLAAASEFGASVLQGNEPDIQWGIGQGARGCVPVCANVDPGLYVRLCVAARDGDGETAASLQAQADALRDDVLIGDHSWIAGVMEAVRLLSIGDGGVVAPLQRLHDKVRIERIRRVVSSLEGNRS